MAGDERVFGERLMQGFRDAEVDHFHDGLAVIKAGEDVAGFQIAMQDAFLMGVLDGAADGHEEFEAF